MLKIKDPGPVPSTTSTTEVDYGAIGLKGVASRTATSVGLGPGGANLSGTVAGPEGAVGGATVHVERLVGASSAKTDIVTQPDGTWTLPAVLGGRYRIRAWRTPDLAQTKPELLFLQSSETKSLNLRLDRYSGVAVSESIAPNPPRYGQPANLFVLVANRSVDAGGVVTSSPVSGASADLSGSGYQLETSNPTVTGNDGVAEWRVRCTTYNQASLSVTVASGGTFQLTLPQCVDPNAPVTTVPPTSTTIRTQRTTTTRR